MWDRTDASPSSSFSLFTPFSSLQAYHNYDLDKMVLEATMIMYVSIDSTWGGRCADHRRLLELTIPSTCAMGTTRQLDSELRQML